MVLQLLVSLFLMDFGVIATYYASAKESALKMFNENNFTESEARLFEIDVSNTEDCATKLLSALLEEEGRVDVIVNNAGITRDGLFKKMSAQNWKDVINTNLNSVFNVTQPLFGAMCEQKYGRIVNISSVNGLKATIFGQTNYSAAKAGMIGFSKALAAEGARVWCHSQRYRPWIHWNARWSKKMKPEALESIVGQVPMKRLAKPEEIAKAIKLR
ncbi:SDR family NAD(P)-dependent oxidoreductase [Vibrio sp. PP-XX7]